MFNSSEPHLDKSTKSFIDKLEAAASKPLYELTPHAAREFLINLQRESYEEIEADIVDTFINVEDIGEVDVRFVRPKGTNDKILPMILYLHGGGWILGDKESHDMLVRKLANCTNSVVVYVNYSHSPESVFPVAINEAYGVLEYLAKNAKDYNIDSRKIVVAGDSAGGNMAIAVCLKSKIENGPKISCQVLLYPVIDPKMNTNSYSEFKNGPWLSKKAMEWFWDAYVPNKNLRNDRYISPLNAENSILKGLPQTLIIVAENDVLRDEGELFAQKLDEAGVEVTSVRINNTHHDFLMLNALQKTNPARAALSLVCNMICQIYNK